MNLRDDPTPCSGILFFSCFYLKINVGTPTETVDGTDAEKHIPPCRLAGFSRAPRPLCGRQLTLKALRYTHVCSRSFDPAQQAREQQIAAECSVKDRMTSLERLAERKAEHAADNKNQVRTFNSILNCNCRGGVCNG